MLGITHTIVGAALGERVNNSVIAFILGVISHLIIDKIPHFWPETKKGQNKQIWVDALGVILLFITYLFWPLPNKINIFWGAFGGASVDLVFVIFPFYYPKFKVNKICAWHEKRQIHKTNPVYLLTDIALVIIGLVLILR